MSLDRMLFKTPTRTLLSEYMGLKIIIEPDMIVKQRTWLDRLFSFSPTQPIVYVPNWAVKQGQILKFEDTLIMRNSTAEKLANAIRLKQFKEGKTWPN